MRLPIIVILDDTVSVIASTDDAMKELKPEDVLAGRVAAFDRDARRLFVSVVEAAATNVLGRTSTRAFVDVVSDPKAQPEKELVRRLIGMRLGADGAEVPLNVDLDSIVSALCERQGVDEGLVTTPAEGEPVSFSAPWASPSTVVVSRKGLSWKSRFGWRWRCREWHEVQAGRFLVKRQPFRQPPVYIVRLDFPNDFLLLNVSTVDQQTSYPNAWELKRLIEQHVTLQSVPDQGLTWMEKVAYGCAALFAPLLVLLMFVEDPAVEIVSATAATIFLVAAFGASRAPAKW